MLIILFLMEEVFCDMEGSLECVEFVFNPDSQCHICCSYPHLLFNSFFCIYCLIGKD